MSLAQLSPSLFHSFPDLLYFLGQLSFGNFCQPFSFCNSSIFGSVGILGNWINFGILVSGGVPILPDGDALDLLLKNVCIPGGWGEPKYFCPVLYEI